MINYAALSAEFQQHFDAQPRIFHAPGRVNLIGEHTDYNDGFVLPMAIDRGTTAAAAIRADRLVRIRSLNLAETIELDLDHIGSGRSGRWRDYAEGIAAALRERGAALNGADIALLSDVSIGGGLSSSAALEIALGTALLSLSGLSLPPLELALAGQAAEHSHAGIMCGIMDQFICTHALQEHALLLDCRSLQAQPVPLKLHDYQIVLCDSRVRHALASSEYNLRRRDCHTGVELLQSVLPAVRSLRDVSADELEMHRALLPETVYRRCRHVVSENARTLKAAEALAAGDTEGMGKLMSASHQSLRDDYEVSCPELDLLVKCAEVQPGVLGARMTGGGFGGCTVNLVKKSNFESFRRNVSAHYETETNVLPEIFAVEASAAAREISLCPQPSLLETDKTVGR